MTMDELKELSERIRFENKDRLRVLWPKGFKQTIIGELSSGKQESLAFLAGEIPVRTRGKAASSVIESWTQGGNDMN